MAIYTKLTDFASKDALASGNPSKLVKGTEIDAEFTSIAAADATSIKNTGNQSIAGVKTFSDTTDASSSTVGGTIVSGGLAIAKKVFVGTDASIGGVVELGHASDTTLSRSSAGVIAVEGVTVPLNSTTSTHTAQQIELGHASDTTITRTGAGAIAVEGVNVLMNGGALGTPSSGTLSGCTGLPVSTGISGLGAGVATFLATPSSANLISAVTDETGSGSLVFGTSPTLTTPKATTTIGVGNATPSASGSGITFPAAQSASTDANTLDDYEEGTFTPTVIGTSTAGSGTYSSQVGRYTKNGNIVKFTLYVNITNHTGTGNIRISSLPFSMTAWAGWEPCGVISSNLALTAGNIICASVNGGASTIEIGQMPTGGGAVSFAVPMDTAFELAISGSYQTA